jgi:hypothetical protein
LTRTPSTADPRSAAAAALFILTACSPHPRLIAVAEGERGIGLLDGALVRTGAFEAPASARDEHITAVHLSGDGLRVVAALASSTGGSLATLRRLDGGPAGARRLAWRPTAIQPLADGRMLLVTGTVSADAGAGGVVVLYDLSDQFAPAAQPVCAARPAGAAVWSEGGRAYVTCPDETIVEIDAALRQVVRSVPLPRASGTQPCEAAGADLSLAGTALLIACARSGMLLYLDRVTLTPFDSMRVGLGATALAVARGGRTAALALSGGELVVVDVPGRRVRARWQLPPPVGAVAMSRDGSWVFAVTRDGSPSAELVKLEVPSGRAAARRALPRGGRALSLWPGSTPPIMRWTAAPAGS